MKAKYWSYRDRKTRKRTFRYLWIQRLNAAARANGMTYSRLAEGLKAAGVGLDRKILADIAVNDAGAFKAIRGGANKCFRVGLHYFELGGSWRLGQPLSFTS